MYWRKSRRSPQRCVISTSYPRTLAAQKTFDRSGKLPFSSNMPSRFHSVTSPRFERRIPAGRHDLVFRVAFGSDGRAARFLRVSKMTIWRWRHDRCPLPEYVIRVLPDLLQDRVAAAHEAQQNFRYFLAEPPSGPSISRMHPVQLDDGTIVFVKRRRANSRR
jgi:hypothetical protein